MAAMADAKLFLESSKLHSMPIMKSKRASLSTGLPSHLKCGNKVGIEENSCCNSNYHTYSCQHCLIPFQHVNIIPFIFVKTLPYSSYPHFHFGNPFVRKMEKIYILPVNWKLVFIITGKIYSSQVQ